MIRLITNIPLHISQSCAKFHVNYPIIASSSSITSLLTSASRNRRYASWKTWNNKKKTEPSTTSQKPNQVHTRLKELLLDMPKEPKHIPAAQAQRRKIKERYTKAGVPGKIVLQVLGTGAEGAPRSLYIFTDQSRYLFNCGEGTQRLANEHKMRLAKLENIFITQAVWKNMGGLPGTALTMQDVGVPDITLHGPKGLDKLFSATKRFVIMKDMDVKMADCVEPYSDNVMEVRYVPLTKSSKETPSTSLSDSIAGSSDTVLSGTSNGRRIDDSDDTDYYQHESKEHKPRSRSRRRSRSRHNSRSKSRNRSMSGNRYLLNTISAETRRELQQIKDVGSCMAYVCRLKPRPGMLIIERCASLGVPPGQLLGKLKNGEDVTLPNGNVIKSSDVRQPDDPGPIFIVIDCPSEDYLDAVLSNKEFACCQQGAGQDDDLATVIVHFTPLAVLNTDRYQEWINRFSPSTQHLLVNEANSCMGSIAVHRIQYKLNLISNSFFPLLGDTGSRFTPAEAIETPAIKRPKSFISPTKDEATGQISQLSVEPSEPSIFKRVNTLCSFYLRPKRGFDCVDEIKIVPSEYINETMALENFAECLNTVKLQLAERCQSKAIRDYPRLIFGGTGSCIPNKTRNTSAIILQTSPRNYILMDCGEGTYGQIVRFFGPEKAQHVLANLNAIYISHLHADHHIGLFGVLMGRRRAMKSTMTAKPLMLFAPQQITHWLNFYDTCFETIQNDFILIPNAEMLLSQNTLTPEIRDCIRTDLEMSDISTAGVRHCPNAFAVRFTHRDGYSITYSGDTMPCDSLVELGMDCDLLIHEATMEDDLAHEAITKLHSTTSQAIEQGERMRAKHIMLTHFSQRYAKLPRFNENFTEKVGIAFDNMQIRFDELDLLPLLNPALQAMFAEHTEEVEARALKRQLKLERANEANKAT